MTNTPTLSEVLDRVTKKQLADFYTAMPAKVLSYDSTKQKATVQILLKNYRYTEEGDRESVEIPPIPDVPVMFPGANGFRLTFPIAAGDIVLLIFTSRSLDLWLAKGGLVDSKDDRANDLSDAIAIPGLRNFADPLSSAPTDRVSLGNDSGNVKIDIDDSEIRAGGSAALALLSELNSLRSAVATHTHTGVSTGAGTSGAPTPGQIPSAFSGTSILKGG